MLQRHHEGSPLKGTSNRLAEFQNPLKITQIFLNFLNDIRDISPEINLTLPCSFPPGVSQTCWNLTNRFLWKAPNFFSNQSIQQNCVDLLKNLIDMLIKHLYVHDVAK